MPPSSYVTRSGWRTGKAPDEQGLEAMTQATGAAAEHHALNEQEEFEATVRAGAGAAGGRGLHRHDKRSKYTMPWAPVQTR
jgi:hypothetical protein